MYKALLVGINAYPQSPLAGCINDVLDVANHLVEDRGYTRTDLRILTDADATKENILTSFREMVQGASAGDHLFLHLSGHGTQIAAASPDEADGVDEVFCPFDFTFANRATALADDEIAAVISQIPADVALTIVVDACHSGSIERDPEEPQPRFLPPPPVVAWLAAHGAKVRSRLRARSLSRAAVISACGSEETAKDAHFDGRANGAFTYHWLRTVKPNADATIQTLVNSVSGPLASFDMHPELAAAAELSSATYIRTPAPVTRDLPRQPIRDVVFRQRWTANAGGVQVGVELKIDSGDSGVDLYFTVLLGGEISLPPIHVSGNLSQRFEIGWGFALVVDVSEWSTQGDRISLRLGIGIAPPFGFFGTVSVFDDRIIIPLRRRVRDLVAPKSFADLQALGVLLGGSSCGCTVPRGPCQDFSQPIVSRGDAQLLIDLGPTDDWAEVTVDGRAVLSHQLNEQNVSRQMSLPDGDHVIRVRLLNSGGWGWRVTVSLAVNGEYIGRHSMAGGSGAYAGEIHEAAREWFVRIEGGRMVNWGSRAPAMPGTSCPPGTMPTTICATPTRAALPERC